MTKSSILRSLAIEILDLEDSHAWLFTECKRLNEIEKKYDDLINQNIQHSEELMGNMIKAMLHKADEEKTKLYHVVIFPNQDHFDMCLSDKNIELLKTFSAMSESLEIEIKEIKDERA